MRLNKEARNNFRAFFIVMGNYRQPAAEHAQQQVNWY